ncbi:hypothetical protein NPIL_49811 [Nephila pilipes]|uniref:Uncharacterized protein n=1 Tax=Nephila pilipes TaxID=299642 RepID=A0A8X6QBE3_NEPPI|nr:hypothetical protein NPIL_49811 [Nephila pilipes]
MNTRMVPQTETKINIFNSLSFGEKYSSLLFISFNLPRYSSGLTMSSRRVFQRVVGLSPVMTQAPVVSLELMHAQPTGCEVLTWGYVRASM